jgi:prevent-host-death family protein
VEPSVATKISLRDANQRFAKLVREVESGREFVVTRRGLPVARIVSAADKRILTAEQEAARRRSAARLAKGWALNLGRIERARLHDD